MSCQSEKVADLFDRMYNSGRLEAIKEAKGHVYRSAKGNGADLSESQMPKNSYDEGGMVPMGLSYGLGQGPAPDVYQLPGRVWMYDIAPARMPAQVGVYGRTSERNLFENKLSENEQLDAHADRLAEMITAARNEGEQRWMSTMR